MIIISYIFDKIKEKILDFIISFLIQSFPCYVVYRLVNLEGKKKVIWLLLKPHKWKVIKIKKNERRELKFIIAPVNLIDKIKAKPVISDSLLLGPGK